MLMCTSVGALCSSREKEACQQRQMVSTSERLPDPSPKRERSSYRCVYILIVLPSRGSWIRELGGRGGLAEGGGMGQTMWGAYLDDELTPYCLEQIKCFGLNRMDVMQRQGFYPLPPGVSTILGVEFSGIVTESLGSTWTVGDEVFGLAFGGAYAEYIAVAEGMCSKKPEGVSWVQAASIPENWLTAWQAMYWIAEMQPGQSILIHAGCSGVGLAAIQLAKEFGA